MSQETYIYLIYQQLQGKLSKTDEKRLQDWLAQSPDNQDIKTKIEQSLDLLADYQPDFPIDLEKDYAQVQAKMESSDTRTRSQESPKVVPIHSRRRWLSIAATVALIVCSYFVYQQFQSPAMTWLVLETGAQESKEITLSDGSTVSLSENSRLSYPKTFLTEDRPVQLEGEAFFNITKNPQQAFRIKSKLALVEVLGTSFTLRAYPKEKTTQINVATGKVKFAAQQSEEAVILTADQTAILQHNSQQIEVNKISNTPPILFKGSPLPEVFKTLEDIYEIQITVENPQLNACQYNGSFQRQEKVEKILNAIKQHYQIEFQKVSPNKYIIKGGNC